MFVISKMFTNVALRQTISQYILKDREFKIFDCVMD